MSAMAEGECGRDCVCSGGLKPSVKDDFDSKRNERSLSIRMNTAYNTWFTWNHLAGVNNSSRGKIWRGIVQSLGGGGDSSLQMRRWLLSRGKKRGMTTGWGERADWERPARGWGVAEVVSLVRLDSRQNDWLTDWLIARLIGRLTAEAWLGSSSWYDTRPPASTQPNTLAYFSHFATSSLTSPRLFYLTRSRSLSGPLHFSPLCAYFYPSSSSAGRSVGCAVGGGVKIGKTSCAPSMYKSIPSQMRMCVRLCR